VNVQTAIVSTNEGKKELDALQQRFAPRSADLRKLYNEIQDLEKQLQSVQGTLSEEETAARTSTIEAKQKTLQRNSDDLQSEVQDAQQQIGGRIGGKMQNVLQKYALDHGYWVVLDVSTQQNQVVWAHDGADITNELVNAYNVQFPATPPARSGAGGTSAKP
jgi:Skp family chaperone for outer membrane proteins